MGIRECDFFYSGRKRGKRREHRAFLTLLYIQGPRSVGEECGPRKGSRKDPTDKPQVVQICPGMTSVGQ